MSQPHQSEMLKKVREQFESIKASGGPECQAMTCYVVAYVAGLTPHRIEIEGPMSDREAQATLAALPVGSLPQIFETFAIIEPDEIKRHMLKLGEHN